MKFTLSILTVIAASQAFASASQPDFWVCKDSQGIATMAVVRKAVSPRPVHELYIFDPKICFALESAKCPFKESAVKFANSFVTKSGRTPISGIRFVPDEKQPQLQLVHRLENGEGLLDKILPYSRVWRFRQGECAPIRE